MQSPVTFISTPLDGVVLIENKRFGDERGFFVETHSQRYWEAAGIEANFVQDNLSCSRAGTLRGLHYQIPPHAMGKYVMVVMGAIFDVAVDMRRGSPTYGQWYGETLSADNGRAMWVPEGFAHGFQALEDDTRVYYKCTGFYAPESERCVHYADPAIGIAWPVEPKELSDRDTSAPPLDEAEHPFTYSG
jgi:dTDP-4-dehydrorhamnose 3,5-epimerase